MSPTMSHGSAYVVSSIYNSMCGNGVVSGLEMCDIGSSSILGVSTVRFSSVGVAMDSNAQVNYTQGAICF